MFISKEINGYILKKKIGSGSFSVVYLGEHKFSGQIYAIKAIKRSLTKEEYVKNEVKVLKKTLHPNIVGLHDHFELDGIVYLVMDYAYGGELFERLVKHGSFCEADAVEIMKNLLSAVNYLHSNNIVHRDLKPGNLLLKTEGDVRSLILSDFGFSKMLSPDMLVMRTACGTPAYVAPEIVTCSKTKKSYGFSADMWSIGVIAYVLLSGRPPFNQEELGKLLESVCSAMFDYPEKYWKEISPEAVNFINQLLIVDPTKRMTAAQALKHPWMTQTPSTKPLVHVNDQIDKYNIVRRAERNKIAAELTLTKSPKPRPKS